jgi:hypothetical protein
MEGEDGIFTFFFLSPSFPPIFTSIVEEGEKKAHDLESCPNVEAFSRDGLIFPLSVGRYFKKVEEGKNVRLL